MNLRELLQEHGITTIDDFAKRAKLSSQQAWNLWHGHSQVGLRVARNLSTRLRIPIAKLANLEPTPKTAASRKKRQPRQEDQA
jgi:transcriptional regulator with XRE-family HTH domain